MFPKKEDKPMPEANSAPFLLSPVSRYPRITSPEPGPKPKLLDCFRGALRSRHYSQRTEQSYCHWVRCFIFFHNMWHPEEMAEPEINVYLTHLAVKEKISASKQNQALSALLFSENISVGRTDSDSKCGLLAHRTGKFPPALRRPNLIP